MTLQISLARVNCVSEKERFCFFGIMALVSITKGVVGSGDGYFLSDMLWARLNRTAWKLSFTMECILA